MRKALFFLDSGPTIDVSALEELLVLVNVECGSSRAKCRKYVLYFIIPFPLEPRGFLLKSDLSGTLYASGRRGLVNPVDRWVGVSS